MGKVLIFSRSAVLNCKFVCQPKINAAAGLLVWFFFFVSKCCNSHPKEVITDSRRSPGEMAKKSPEKQYYCKQEKQ